MHVACMHNMHMPSWSNQWESVALVCLRRVTQAIVPCSGLLIQEVIHQIQMEWQMPGATMISIVLALLKSGTLLDAELDGLTTAISTPHDRFTLLLQEDGQAVIAFCNARVRLYLHDTASCQVVGRRALLDMRSCCTGITTGRPPS